MSLLEGAAGHFSRSISFRLQSSSMIHSFPCPLAGSTPMFLPVSLKLPAHFHVSSNILLWSNFNDSIFNNEARSFLLERDQTKAFAMFCCSKEFNSLRVASQGIKSSASSGSSGVAPSSSAPSFADGINFP